MSIDAARARAALQSIHPGTLSADDAETIVAFSQLAIDADGKEDADEIDSFFAMGKAVYALAGLTETPSPSFDTDEELDERVRTLSAKLSTIRAKELAYAVSYVMVVSDVELEPAESSLLDDMREALGISDDRAAELAGTIAAAITPPA